MTPEATTEVRSRRTGHPTSNRAGHVFNLSETVPASDIDPDKTDMRRHAHQLEDYLRATGTVRGALVYMTLGNELLAGPALRRSPRVDTPAVGKSAGPLLAAE